MKESLFHALLRLSPSGLGAGSNTASNYRRHLKTSTSFFVKLTATDACTDARGLTDLTENPEAWALLSVLQSAKAIARQKVRIFEVRDAVYFDFCQVVFKEHFPLPV